MLQNNIFIMLFFYCFQFQVVSIERFSLAETIHHFWSLFFWWCSLSGSWSNL